jgi:NAD(P)-dependent dehydrogenase (short-subunit alcohol dehydrogenase family)
VRTSSLCPNPFLFTCIVASLTPIRTNILFRVIAQCQSATSEALLAFSRIDVLLICQSEALVGSIEELSQSARALSLVRDQFESNFFAPVNMIKAVLPGMRDNRGGHIVAITGISESFRLLCLNRDVWIASNVY